MTRKLSPQLQLLLLEQIQVMIRKVDPLSGAVLVDQTTSVKPGYTSLTLVYKSSASYDDVKDHYQHELDSLGFIQYREFSPSLSDLRSIHYCKGIFDATLDYFTDSAREFNYRFIMSWDNAILVGREQLCS